VAGQLIVSVSGIRNSTLDDVGDFCTELDTRGVPLSLLLTPCQAGGYRLSDDSRTAQWLRCRRERGDAVVLNGYDTAATNKRRPEFASLPAHEANLRLMAADRVLEHVGLRTRLFAPPGWLASQGAAQALARNGFRVLAGLSGVTDLVRQTTTRARVIAIGAGLLTEPWWCRTLVLAAERTARRGGDVRITVSGRQLRGTGPRLAVLDAVDLALMHAATPGVYCWQPLSAGADAA
jgi:predicted deacetylase